MSEFAAFIGFDWADKKHDLCLVDAATGKKEFSIIKHTPQALEEWARALLSRFGGRKVAVCLEQSRAKARATTLERFFREHNSVRKEGNQQRISPIKEAVALTHDRAVIDS